MTVAVTQKQRAAANRPPLFFAREVQLTRTYVFRADDFYRGGPVGRSLGAEADSADIQNLAEHVLRKKSNRTSRYVSVTLELKIARRFTKAPDYRHVRKVEYARLLDLMAQGIINIWDATRVNAELTRAPKKLARKARYVRAMMERNSELLIEGQFPAEFLEYVN
jgi:hypothetical protein